MLRLAAAGDMVWRFSAHCHASDSDWLGARFIARNSVDSHKSARMN